MCGREGLEGLLKRYDCDVDDALGLRGYYTARITFLGKQVGPLGTAGARACAGKAPWGRLSKKPDCEVYDVQGLRHGLRPSMVGLLGTAGGRAGAGVPQG